MDLVEVMARALWEDWRKSPVANEVNRNTSWDDLLRWAHKNQHIKELVDAAYTQVRAALKAAEEAGWVLAPMEPTEAMCEAGDNDIAQCDADIVYRAMIAARPAIESEGK